MEHRKRSFGPGARQPWLRAGIASAVLLGGAIIVFTTLSAGASDNGGRPPGASKSESPANINPEKHPVLDPAKITPEPAEPTTPAQQRAQAASWKAQDPDSRVVCLRPDGSVAGSVSLDRVDPSAHLTPAEAASVCDDGFPGSRP
jgi:hypothetical protein